MILIYFHGNAEFLSEFLSFLIDLKIIEFEFDKRTNPLKFKMPDDFPISSLS